LKETIKQLEIRKMTLVQSLGLIEEAVKCVDQVEGPLSGSKRKTHNVLNKNPGIKCLKLIRYLLRNKWNNIAQCFGHCNYEICTH